MNVALFCARKLRIRPQTLTRVPFLPSSPSSTDLLFSLIRTAGGRDGSSLRTIFLASSRFLRRRCRSSSSLLAACCSLASFFLWASTRPTAFLRALLAGGSQVGASVEPSLGATRVRY